METLASMRAIIEEWIGEPLEPKRINNAINGSIQSLWLDAIQWQVSLFTSGPATFTIDAASELAILISVANPTAAPTASGTLNEGSLGSRTYIIKYTYVTESGTETLVSPGLSLPVSANYVATVNPPSAASGAFGWNLYVDGYLQNEMPISFADTYIEPITGFSPDAQNMVAEPIDNSTADDIFYIRHLESPLTSGGYRAWSPHDLDSMVMKYYSLVQATASEYQNYAWDLLEGNRFEIRPAAGMSINPRFFYIKRPRNLKYDNAPIPFMVFPAEEFIKFQALSDLCITIDEYTRSDRYQGRADREKHKIISALIQRSRGKVQRIIPFVA